jgi:putative endonuclease
MHLMMYLSVCERCVRMVRHTSIDPLTYNFYTNFMPFTYIYVLQSLNHDFVYVGITSDLKRRFHEHQTGQNTSTKPYSPYRLIHYEAYICEADAKRRENYFKTTKGRVTLRQMLKVYFNPSNIFNESQYLSCGLKSPTPPIISRCV